MYLKTELNVAGNKSVYVVYAHICMCIINNLHKCSRLCCIKYVKITLFFSVCKIEHMLVIFQRVGVVGGGRLLRLA